MVSFRGRQWETVSLILCLRWDACENACAGNKSRLVAILFLCRAKLPLFHARIWPHFNVKITPTQVPSLQHTNWNVSRTAITITSLLRIFAAAVATFFWVEDGARAKN